MRENHQLKIWHLIDCMDHFKNFVWLVINRKLFSTSLQPLVELCVITYSKRKYVSISNLIVFFDAQKVHPRWSTHWFLAIFNWHYIRRVSNAPCVIGACKHCFVALVGHSSLCDQCEGQTLLKVAGEVVSRNTLTVWIYFSLVYK